MIEIAIHKYMKKEWYIKYDGFKKFIYFNYNENRWMSPFDYSRREDSAFSMLKFIE